MSGAGTRVPDGWSAADARSSSGSRQHADRALYPFVPGPISDRGQDLTPGGRRVLGVIPFRAANLRVFP
jgi:hypothetical protein